MTEGKRICLGVFTGAHGVKGAAKIKTFTAEPQNIAAYGPLSSEDNQRSFTLTYLRDLKNGVALVSAPEIPSREDAMALSGLKLFIDRDRLPPPDDEDEFYLEDLIGLNAFSEDGAALGVVAAVLNFGAGDLIELRDIPSLKGARLIPFTKQAAPIVNLKERRIVISAAFLPAPSEESPGEPQKG